MKTENGISFFLFRSSYLSPICRCSMVPSGRSISTWPLRMTDHESSSSPSFMTMVPIFSTTANTMTAHSARRIASVMLAKACKVNGIYHRLKIGKRIWIIPLKTKIVMMPTLSSLVALEVVVTTSWQLSRFRVLSYAEHWCLNTLRLRQNGHHFADNTFKCIFLNENVSI